MFYLRRRGGSLGGKRAKQRRLSIRLRTYAIITALLIACICSTWAEAKAEQIKKEKEREYVANEHGTNHAALHRRSGKDGSSRRFVKEQDKQAEGGGVGAREVDSVEDSVSLMEGVKESEERAFELTAYTAFCDSGCTGITASGYDVSNTITYTDGRRILAADPSVLPLGTVVEVKFSDGERIEAVVQDTGGSIKGARLDLLVGSKEEAFEIGRQGVKVRILD